MLKISREEFLESLLFLDMLSQDPEATTIGFVAVLVVPKKIFEGPAFVGGLASLVDVLALKHHATI
jgi:hypothetical protein